VLKTTATILLGLIAVAWGCTAALAQSPSVRDSAASGSSPSLTPDEARRQSDDLLHRARQAMAENDLAAAGELIARADAFQVPYGVLYMGDTPKKLRLELDRKLKAAASDPQAGRPLDPFAARGGQAVGPAAAGSEASLRFPGAETAMPASPLAGRDPMSLARPSAPGAATMPAVGPDPNRLQSNTLLLEARRALAVGDITTATAKVQQARSLAVAYGPNDDNPARIEALIATAKELADTKKRWGETDGYRHQFARLLLEEGQAMLRWRDYDEAERLAGAAAQQYNNFSPSELQPRTLLERIAVERRQSQAAGASGGSPVPGAMPSMAARQKAAELVRQARMALAAGDAHTAEDLAHRAQNLQVPESLYAPQEDRPSYVLRDVHQAQLYGPSAVVQAAGQYAAGATGAGDYDHRAAPAVYDPAADRTWNMQAGNQQPQQGDLAGTPGATGPENLSPPVPTQQSPAMALVQQGERAARAHQRDAALNFFRQAAARSQELDPMTRQHVQDMLQALSAPASSPVAGQGNNTLIDDAAAKQQALAKQVAMEVAHQEANADKLKEKDPEGALNLLVQTRQKVESSGLDQGTRDQILHRLDRKLSDMKQFVEQNRPRIELEKRNAQVRQSVDHDQQVMLDTQQKMAAMVEEYNQLMREQRVDEAEVVAKRAVELDPRNGVAQQILQEAKLIRAYTHNMTIKNNKEEGFLAALEQVDRAAIPFNDNEPFVMGDAKRWDELTRRRAKYSGDSQRSRWTERELEIKRKLKTPVMVSFNEAPLAQVMDYLAKQAQVNLFLDPEGLAQEGVSTAAPVTLNLAQEISLQSALNLILQPRHLAFVIKDEVLKITSEQLKNGEVYTVTYNVADLVIPIPNFVPSPNMGLDGALHNAMNNVGFNQGGGLGGAAAAPLAVVASSDGGSHSGMINPALMAQISSAGGGKASAGRLGGAGPGGLGGGAQADFDSLIDLITSTIQPTTWDDVGGPGSIAPFETNLSIVVSQTQDVHEQIVDLLEQLRRLQDLQVTIEVRFITLNDNFFEFIGVDFDFKPNPQISHPYSVFGAEVSSGNAASGIPPTYNTTYVPQAAGFQGQSTIVGLSAPGAGAGAGQAQFGTFASDLQIPFTQNSFTLAQPTFGTFQQYAGLNFGFAILSDIEAYFFVTASSGDVRTNVLQAPKVTLFNGQQAFVSDTTQAPFVISVIPVVGDFAAAYQPVIVVLSQGTFLTVQAVISNDRRFVRLTVVPFFSNIGQVNTFTFEGSTSTTSSSSTQGVQSTPNDNTHTAAAATTTSQGTTVQLPTFSFVTVTTTVSVPDGGTVLLGGIKRLSEDRSEFGTPILDQIPYLNRLFKNVGIGRETQSLMMMVTPRIIIQEEEEEKLGIPPP
jgi:general secretion pathway protein D